MNGTSNRQLILGAMLEGAGMDRIAWLDPSLPGDASVDIGWYIENAKLAEAAGFDLVFVADVPFVTPDTSSHFLNQLEPLTLLSAVAAATSRIGLVATVSTSYTEPYNAARQLASLDNISRGRAGWNVVTTALEGASRNYGRDRHFGHADRYARAREFVQVVRGLWDSYEDDAFPRDRESGIFLDPAKQHPLDHRGTYFSVAGPLAITRSKQGQPVIFLAGDSEEGRELGGEIAEAAFAAAQDFESALAYSTDLKARAARQGRGPDHVLVLQALGPVIADTDDEAHAIQNARRDTHGIAKGLANLGETFNNHDFTAYPLDDPFPVLDGVSVEGYKSRARLIIDTARAERLTLRDVVWRFGVWRSDFVGTPATVAREIERWFAAGAADGFMLRISRPRDFALFRDRVVPILQERGLFRTDYRTDTLRGHLGLEVPRNRWAP